MATDRDEAAGVAYYDRLAGDYAFFFADFEASMEREGKWLDEVLRRDGTVTVLDASCGSGRQAIPLAGLGYRIVGADPCSAMLAQARDRARAAGVDLPLHKMAFTDLPGPLTESFDAVIALGNGLCHQERREEIVASRSEERRV